MTQCKALGFLAALLLSLVLVGEPAPSGPHRAALLTPLAVQGLAA